ncbi:MAG: hypothetical protein P8X98_05605, partial [Woeseiaceae bacterium]
MRPDHHNPDGTFRNPHLAPGQIGLTSFLKMRFGRGNDWPSHTRQRERIPLTGLDGLENGAVPVTPSHCQRIVQNGEPHRRPRL